VPSPRTARRGGGGLRELPRLGPQEPRCGAARCAAATPAGSGQGGQLGGGVDRTLSGLGVALAQERVVTCSMRPSSRSTALWWRRRWRGSIRSGELGDQLGDGQGILVVVGLTGNHARLDEPEPSRDAISISESPLAWASSSASGSPTRTGRKENPHPPQGRRAGGLGAPAATPARLSTGPMSVRPVHRHRHRHRWDDRGASRGSAGGSPECACVATGSALWLAVARGATAGGGTAGSRCA